MTMLTDLAAAVQWPGLKSSTRPGWQARGRRAFKVQKPRAIVVHHTASVGDKGTENVCANGRPGLSGPLCQLVLTSDGEARVIAAGVGNHAGRTVNDAVYGNDHSLAIEAVHDGVSAWGGKQYRAYVQLVAAVAEHYGIPNNRIQGHKEIAIPHGRKIDPNFSMKQFREDVARERQLAWSAGERVLMRGSKGNDVRVLQELLKILVDGDFGGGTHEAVLEYQRANGLGVDGIVGENTWKKLLDTPQPDVVVSRMEEDDDMALSDEDVRRIADAVLDTPIKRQGLTEAESSLFSGDTTTLRSIVAHTDKFVLLATQNSCTGSESDV